MGSSPPDRRTEIPEAGAGPRRSQPGYESPVKTTIVALLCLVACTPVRPRVSLVRGASLKSYHTFVVASVSDATHYPFTFPITDSLRQRIAARLRERGLTVAETPADPTGPLVITSTLNVFKSGSLGLQLPTAVGTSRCMLSSELTDGRTGQRVGEIEASEITGEDSQPMSPFRLLMLCAQMTADELTRQVRH